MTTAPTLADSNRSCPPRRGDHFWVANLEESRPRWVQRRAEKTRPTSSRTMVVNQCPVRVRLRCPSIMRPPPGHHSWPQGSLRLDTMMSLSDATLCRQAHPWPCVRARRGLLLTGAPGSPSQAPRRAAATPAWTRPIRASASPHSRCRRCCNGHWGCFCLCDGLVQPMG